MKPAVRFLRHGGVYRPMCLFESLTRSAAFRTGPGQTFRTHRKFLRPTHRRDEPRPVIPQWVARQHCPPTLHRHAHPKTVPGSGTMNFQRTFNSVLTVCLSRRDNPTSPATTPRGFDRLDADRGPFGLAEGAAADCLVLDENPLTDLNAITRIRLCVKSGSELLKEAFAVPGREDIPFRWGKGNQSEGKLFLLLKSPIGTRFETVNCFSPDSLTSLVPDIPRNSPV